MSAPRTLADDEYDAEGWPKFSVDISRQAYSLALGPQTCWLAQFPGLPGYYGEGASIDNALLQLRTSLGARPHYQVEHKIRTPKKLEGDLKRRFKAIAAAAVTIGPAWPHGKGGGEAVDGIAKELRIGKTAANRARRELLEKLSPPPGQSIAGVSKVALAVIARPTEIRDQPYGGSAFEALEMALWVAKEAPWRAEHTEARDMFPDKKG